MGDAHPTNDIHSLADPHAMSTLSGVVDNNNIRPVVAVPFDTNWDPCAASCNDASAPDAMNSATPDVTSSFHVAAADSTNVKILEAAVTLQRKREKKRRQRKNKEFTTKENEANLKQHKSNMLNDVEGSIKCRERNKLAQRKLKAKKRRMKLQQLKQVAWVELTDVIGELNQNTSIQKDPKFRNKLHLMTTVLGMELINKDNNENDEEAATTTVDETVSMDSDTDDDEDNNNKYLNDEQLTLAKQFLASMQFTTKVSCYS